MKPSADLLARLKAKHEAESDPVILTLETLRGLSAQLDEIQSDAKKREGGGGKGPERFWQIVSGVLGVLLAASIFGWVNLERRVSLIESGIVTTNAWILDIVADNKSRIRELENERR